MLQGYSGDKGSWGSRSCVWESENMQDSLRLLQRFIEVLDNYLGGDWPAKTWSGDAWICWAALTLCRGSTGLDLLWDIGGLFSVVCLLLSCPYSLWVTPHPHWSYLVEPPVTLIGSSSWTSVQSLVSMGFFLGLVDLCKRCFFPGNASNPKHTCTYMWTSTQHIYLVCSRNFHESFLEFLATLKHSWFDILNIPPKKNLVIVKSRKTLYFSVSFGSIFPLKWVVLNMV